MQRGAALLRVSVDRVNLYVMSRSNGQIEEQTSWGLEGNISHIHTRLPLQRASQLGSKQIYLRWKTTAMPQSVSSPRLVSSQDVRLCYA